MQVTGELEEYQSKSLLRCKLAISTGLSVFLVLFTFSLIVGVALFRSFLTYKVLTLT